MVNSVLDVTISKMAEWSEGEAVKIKMCNWSKELIWGEIMNKCLLHSSTWRVWDEAGNIVSNEPAAAMAKLLLSWKLHFSCCSTNGLANRKIRKRKCFPICLSHSLLQITCRHQAGENTFFFPFACDKSDKAASFTNEAVVLRFYDDWWSWTPVYKLKNARGGILVQCNIHMKHLNNRIEVM